MSESHSVEIYNEQQKHDIAAPPVASIEDIGNYLRERPVYPESLYGARTDDIVLETFAQLGIINGPEVFTQLDKITETQGPLGDYLPKRAAVVLALDNSLDKRERQSHTAAVVHTPTQLTIAREEGAEEILVLVEGLDYYGKPTLAATRRDTSVPFYQGGWSEIMVLDDTGNIVETNLTGGVRSPSTEAHSRLEAMHLILSNTLDKLARPTSTN